ncbi:hypothetical protein NEOLI_004219, partial [Neolecta irregularis DAH-3]
RPCSRCISRELSCYSPIDAACDGCFERPRGRNCNLRYPCGECGKRSEKCSYIRFANHGMDTPLNSSLYGYDTRYHNLQDSLTVAAELQTKAKGSCVKISTEPYYLSPTSQEQIPIYHELVDVHTLISRSHFEIQPSDFNLSPLNETFEIDPAANIFCPKPSSFGGLTATDDANMFAFTFGYCQEIPCRRSPHPLDFSRMAQLTFHYPSVKQALLAYGAYSLAMRITDVHAKNRYLELALSYESMAIRLLYGTLHIADGDEAHKQTCLFLHFKAGMERDECRHVISGLGWAYFTGKLMSTGMPLPPFDKPGLLSSRIKALFDDNLFKAQAWYPSVVHSNRQYAMPWRPPSTRTTLSHNQLLQDTVPMYANIPIPNSSDPRQPLLANFDMALIRLCTFSVPEALK